MQMNVRLQRVANVAVYIGGWKIVRLGLHMQSVVTYIGYSAT